jgi:hypothetical protein
VSRRATGSRGRAADLALGATIVFAPLVAGGANIWALPLLVVLATLAYGLTLSALRQEGAHLHVGLLPTAIFGLAAFTLIQTIPIPSIVLFLFDRRAYDVRAFVHDGQTPFFMPITYEMSATLRDASRLVVYGMIALAAHERARSRRGFEVIAKPIAIAGIASVAVAWVHRMFGVDKMFGLIATARPMRDLVTTFVNPNHAAGFLVITTLTAVGLAFNETKPDRKLWLFTAALVSAFAATISFSRGGLAALVVATIAFFVMIVFRTREKKKRPSWRLVTVIFVLAVAVPALAVAQFWEDIAHEFAGSAADPLSISAKLAAFKDAGPMILDHLWFGIGRGSYVSVYPAYKASHLQFTFTHPENIIVQLLSDWGLLVGVAAVIGLFYCVAQRIIKAGSPLSIGAVVAVGAVLLQNMADFSFELPGVAIPVAAVLGATGWGLVRFWRFELHSQNALRLMVGVPGAVALSAAVMAMITGNLDWDLQTIDDEVKTAQELRSRTSPAWVLADSRSSGNRSSTSPARPEESRPVDASGLGFGSPEERAPSSHKHRSRRYKGVASTAEAREADAKREEALAEQARALQEIEAELRACPVGDCHALRWAGSTTCASIARPSRVDRSGAGGGGAPRRRDARTSSLDRRPASREPHHPCANRIRRGDLAAARSEAGGPFREPRLVPGPDLCRRVSGARTDSGHHRSPRPRLHDDASSVGARQRRARARLHSRDRHARQVAGGVRPRHSPKRRGARCAR